MENLILRDGLFYERSSNTPYTGKLDDKRSRGSIVDGKQDGPWVAYWKNGQLSSKGIYQLGKQIGSWFYYFDNGNLLSQESWKEGKQDGLYKLYSYILHVLLFLLAMFQIP